jgi:hypothetical protein
MVHKVDGRQPLAEVTKAVERVVIEATGVTPA